MAARSGPARSVVLPKPCQAVIQGFIDELVGHGDCVDVEASLDKPDVAQDALLAHIASQADCVGAAATKATAVLTMGEVTEAHCKFVCEGLVQPVAMLVSGVQLFCRHCGATRRQEVRSLTRCVHSVL